MITKPTRRKIYSVKAYNTKTQEYDVFDVFHDSKILAKRWAKTLKKDFNGRYIKIKIHSR